jgi:hypothetical protein
MDDQEEENSHNLAHSSDLEIPDCPFVNLPETHSGRWGQGLTKEKMQDCRWPKPIWSANLNSPSGRQRGTCGIHVSGV